MESPSLARRGLLIALTVVLASTAHLGQAEACSGGPSSSPASRANNSSNLEVVQTSQALQAAFAGSNSERAEAMLTLARLFHGDAVAVMVFLNSYPTAATWFSPTMARELSLILSAAAKTGGLYPAPDRTKGRGPKGATKTPRLPAWERALRARAAEQPSRP